ncbi:hypothetical protein BO223_03605 [Faecalibaculum rodentium]|uniref:Uncharacterized protein n=3 Tax=Faecalibaculum rodentium TaxID=1702221 RepID=A0A1Q9YLL2_9FIRM|nr:hypothetical protein BO223_03605 [Faecalibaculum rodentium]
MLLSRQSGIPVGKPAVCGYNRKQKQGDRNMSEQETHSVMAVVAAKEGQYDEIAPEIDPHGDPVFRAAFKTAEGVKIFWITSEEYYRLKVGMKGLLTWKGDELVSFGNWIKPFEI